MVESCAPRLGKLRRSRPQPIAPPNRIRGLWLEPSDGVVAVRRAPVRAVPLSGRIGESVTMPSHGLNAEIDRPLMLPDRRAHDRPAENQQSIDTADLDDGPERRAPAKPPPAHGANNGHTVFQPTRFRSTRARRQGLARLAEERR